MSPKSKTIVRDISWLSFNARVLQEAADPSVPLQQRIRFLGIFSNNLDEFFRVRVATLRRMAEVESKRKLNIHFEDNPEQILEDIQMIVLNHQSEFARIWEGIVEELRKSNIFLVNEKQLNSEQQAFVRQYYEEEVSSYTIPLMIESITEFPYLRDKSIYLGIVMSTRSSALNRKYALIEIPSRVLGRFVLLPSKGDEHHIILLEDVIRFNLPQMFSYFGYNRFHSALFKMTRDAEIDIDNDISTSMIQKIEKGLKNRRRGKPVRFVYDKEMDPGLLEYLIRRMHLSKRGNLTIPGGRIHNFRHFMDFPKQAFSNPVKRRKPLLHPSLNQLRVTDVILKKDVMLHFPYHSFNSVIDLLREAAIDPDVTMIKITLYRVAAHSKIVNALVNAVRNGKQVTVMLELRARFDEEANLEWKERLEDEGVKVLIGIPNLKVHGKLCLIRKKINRKNVNYGFVSTGNLNEKTASLYGDHCLLTANRNIMADITRIFHFLEHPRNSVMQLNRCKTLIPSPVFLRREILRLIQYEIRAVQKGEKGKIIIKMNSLSDEELILRLSDAARAGVEVKLIVRGIFCMLTENNKFAVQPVAISIVDEYLEHARVWVFHNKGKEKVYISSADWMVRNLDHRVEVTCPVKEKGLRNELIDILNIQLSDNVKSRILDNDLKNEYVTTRGKRIRSQAEIYQYLQKKRNKK